MTTIDTNDSAWDELRSRVRGRLVTPGLPDWEAARTPWALNVDQQPLAVLEVADADDVAAAVRWAIGAGVPVTAQPSGHGAKRALDGTLLLRTGALREIRIDEATGTARVGAGVTWGALLQRLDGTGLIGLAGSNSDVTVVGLTLGGGLSWFSRAHGFTANSVAAVELVDAGGDLVRVTEAADPDLFWALRGGGGDFGIVVAIDIALFGAPEIYGGRLLWPIEHAPAVLRAFRAAAERAPSRLTMWAQIFHVPPLPQLPEAIRGRSFVAVALAHLGSADEAEALLAGLRAAAPVELDTVGAVVPSGIGAVSDEPTAPSPSLDHSLLLDGFDDAAIGRLLAVTADRRRCPLVVVQIRSLGGAIAEDAATHGAAGSVAQPYLLSAIGIPVTPEIAAAVPVAFDAIDAALADCRSERLIANFVGTLQDSGAAYPPDALARLRRIKRERDPNGVIRSNRPVLG